MKLGCFSIVARLLFLFGPLNRGSEITDCADDSGDTESSASKAKMSSSSKWVQGNSWLQKTFPLPKRGRGVHLVTDEIKRQIPELGDLKVGLAHIHILHTSASLALNENWDPSVRTDMEAILNRVIPERGVSYSHSCEGPDDMPAHAKSILIGNSITIPIKDGDFELGQWQGIYYCEHRDGQRTRKVVFTLNGALKS